MNDTFNFQEDHPELYAQVQARKTTERRRTIVTYILSVFLSLCILAMLLTSDMSAGLLVIVQSWVALTTSFSVDVILRKKWK